WASTADLKYVNQAIQNSTLFLARDKQQAIVGLVRYITNQHIAYISDMVVDKDHRRQHIATALMQAVCKEINKSSAFSLLISAKEGDGKAVAPKLYGEKFGFK